MSQAADPLNWYDLPHAPPPGTSLGLLDALGDGVPEMRALQTGDGDSPPFRVLLLRSGPQVRAFVNRCAHFGVPLAARQEQLIYTPHVSVTCNVHYARYRWADGHCLSGECDGAGLLPIPLTLDTAGQIHIADVPAH